MIRWAFLGLLLCASGPAFAQDPAIDPAVVTACFEIAPQGSVDPGCIGVAARACMAGTAQTTLDIGRCAMAEAAEWDAILNREYAATRDAHSGLAGLSDHLRAAQRAWIALRDADCAFAYDRHGGGSIRSIDAAFCQMEHTARRALGLRNMREH